MTTKIAVLDDYTDTSRPHFDQLGSGYEVTYFNDTLLPYNGTDTPQSVKDELVKRLEPFPIISTMRERTPFPAELIDRLPNLKVFLTTGHVNRAVDMAAMAKRGIPVVGAHDSGPGEEGNTINSTAEHTIAIMLALAHNVAADDASVHAGGWQTQTKMKLSGKTVGVLGLGRYGVVIARVLSAGFGMKVIAWSPNLTQGAADERATQAGLAVETNGEKTFKAVSKEELFSKADLITLHLPLSDRSRGLVAAEDLARMKPTAYFVNTSRGPIVVEKDLLDVLKQGKIRGAALDVFDLEPLPKDSEWRTTAWGSNGTSRVVLTPHAAYIEEDSMNGFYEQQLENLRRLEKGEELTPLLH